MIGPDKALEKFFGKLTFEGTNYDVDLSQFIYKGSTVKNSGSIIGLVLYTGMESKIMLNSGKHHFKMSRLEKTINYAMLFNICLILTLMLIFILLNFSFNNKHADKLWYIYPEGKEPDFTSLYLIGTYWILFNQFVSLSMLVF